MTEKIKPGIYEHFKGSRYEVLNIHGVLNDTNDREPLVFYKPLYEVSDPDELQVRTLSNFLEAVEFNGSQVPRFRYLDPESED